MLNLPKRWLLWTIAIIVSADRPHRLKTFRHYHYRYNFIERKLSCGGTQSYTEHPCFSNACYLCKQGVARFPVHILL